MNRNVLLPLLALLTALLACEVPAGMTPTAAVVTQIVVVPNPVEPIATLTLIPPTTPSPTATQSASPSPTPTGSGPSATFIKNANCRKGAGTKYEVVTAFETDQTVKIVGRNPDFDNTWWYVEIPTGGKCWVSLTTANASGPFEDIPVIP